MKKAILALLLPVVANLHASDDASMSGDEIIAACNNTQKVETEMAFIKMTTISPGLGAVERRFIAAYRETETGSGYFVRMVYPADIEGVTILSIEEELQQAEQYLYLPAVGKARRLSGSAKAEPFLGSDFTIGDLLREAPQTQKYERRPDKKVQGRECFVVRAFDKEEGISGYGFRDLYIEKDSNDLLFADYYDPKENLIKNFFAVDYRSSEVEGQTTRPHKAIMIDKQSQSTTTFTVIESRINEPIPAELFTPQKIQSWTSDEVREFIFQIGMTGSFSKDG